MLLGKRIWTERVVRDPMTYFFVVLWFLAGVYLTIVMGAKGEMLIALPVMLGLASGGVLLGYRACLLILILYWLMMVPVAATVLALKGITARGALKTIVACLFVHWLYVAYKESGSAESDPYDIPSPPAA